MIKMCVTNKHLYQERTMNYNHLNISERIVISQLKSSGLSIRKIAKQLGRSPSTISRELKRNSYRSIRNAMNRYTPSKAQDNYRRRKYNCGRKTIADEMIVSYVKSKIEDHWSPEQIANRKTTDFNLPSTATIYRMIHQKRLGYITMTRLRRKGKFKRSAENRGKFNDGGRTNRETPKRSIQTCGVRSLGKRYCWNQAELTIKGNQLSVL
jgi:IS30 family transposase